MLRAADSGGLEILGTLDFRERKSQEWHPFIAFFRLSNGTFVFPDHFSCSRPAVIHWMCLASRSICSSRSIAVKSCSCSVSLPALPMRSLDICTRTTRGSGVRNWTATCRTTEKRRTWRPWRRFRPCWRWCPWCALQLLLWWFSSLEALMMFFSSFTSVVFCHIVWCEAGCRRVMGCENTQAFQSLIFPDPGHFFGFSRPTGNASGSTAFWKGFNPQFTWSCVHHTRDATATKTTGWQAS